MAIENLEFGALGTVVYTGLVLGSLFGTKLFSNSQYIKPILTISLGFNAICLVCFTLTPNFALNVQLRLLTGFF